VHVAVGGEPDVGLVVELVEPDAAVRRGAVPVVQYLTQPLTNPAPACLLVSAGLFPVM